MHIKEFLEHHLNPEFFNQYRVICFTVDDEQELPVIFAGLLWNKLAQCDYALESVDLSNVDYAQFLAQINTSFLGMELFYWLHSIDDFDKKNRQKIVDIVKAYQGPHRIMFFAPQSLIGKGSASMMMIEIPKTFTGAFLPSLLPLFQKKISVPVVKALSSQFEKITLDQSCILLNYLYVLGKPDLAAGVFKRTIASETSLFLLSQHFFAKDTTHFFTEWATISNDYSTPFWCTYWSEQLWRASFVRYYLEKNQVTQAKGMAFRLPFSFMQRDWKKHTVQSLQKAHEEIYNVDYFFKNNSDQSLLGLELFYAKFFIN